MQPITFHALVPQAGQSKVDDPLSNAGSSEEEGGTAQDALSFSDVFEGRREKRMPQPVPEAVVADADRQASNSEDQDQAEKIGANNDVKVAPPSKADVALHTENAQVPPKAKGHVHLGTSPMQDVEVAPLNMRQTAAHPKNTPAGGHPMPLPADAPEPSQRMTVGIAEEVHSSTQPKSVGILAGDTPSATKPSDAGFLQASITPVKVRQDAAQIFMPPSGHHSIKDAKAPEQAGTTPHSLVETVKGAPKDTTTLPASTQTLLQPVSTRQDRRAGPRIEQTVNPVATSSATPQSASPPLTPWTAAKPATLVPSEALKSSASLDGDFLSLLRTDTVTATTQAQPQPVAARVDISAHVARQIAEALQHMPNRPVEITLSPEELGRVRLGMSTSEGGILVSVLAERPETTELMRRHIASLETAFQELGYTTISFSFGGEQNADDGTDKQPKNARPSNGTLSDEITPEVTQLHLRSAPISGVDIRL